MVENKFRININDTGVILLGVFLGALNRYVYGAIYLGEVVLLGYFIMKLFTHKGSLILKIDIREYTITLALFIVVISVVGILYHNEFVLKNVLKYLIILCEIYIFYNSFESMERHTELLMFTFIVTSLVITNYSSGLSLYSFMHKLPIAIIFSIYFLFFAQNSKRTLLFLTLLLSVFSLLARSRTSLVIAVLLALYIIRVYGKSSNMNITSLIRLLIIALVVLGVSLYLMAWLGESLSVQSVSNVERDYLIKAAVMEIKERPLFGVGIGNYNNYAQTHLGFSFRASNMSPHNLYLEILSESGIVGFILFFGGIITTIRGCFRNKNMGVDVLLLVLLAYFMFNTFSGMSRIFWTVSISSIIYYQKGEKYENELYMQVE